MPHATHFLERLDRLPRSLTDLALALYRDEARVAWILEYAHLPPEVDRVALALTESNDGPHVIVTRQGKFVTTLGAGMSTGLTHVISRAQLDVFSARVADARARHELAKEIVPPGKEAVDVVGLLDTRPWGLSRTEFAAMGAWAPLMQIDFLLDAFRASDGVPFRRTYLGTPDKAWRRDRDTLLALEEDWVTLHGIGARFALATMGDLHWVDLLVDHWAFPYGPTFHATDSRIGSIAMRGVWAAARMGKPLLPIYKGILARPGHPAWLFDAVLAVTAIGVRHANLRDDARRILSGFARSCDEPLREIAKIMTTTSDRAFDDPEGALTESAVVGALALVGARDRLPPASEFRYATWEEVPREIALVMAANLSTDSMAPLPLYLLPWAAKLASPEELYLPDELARILREPPSAARMVEVYERQHAGLAHEPVKREAAKQGRNEACACGSGKKYKRCCGA